MILTQVRDEMNRVNSVLDELESVQGHFKGKRKAELLGMAARASIRV